MDVLPSFALNQFALIIVCTRVIRSMDRDLPRHKTRFQLRQNI